jgi:hypothetical protein
MKTRNLLGAALLACASLGAQASVTYGSNLIVNGDAEAGVSGWLAYDGYGLVQAVDYGNNWVKPSEPGPADRGSRMFTGVGAYSVGYQMLDLEMVTTQALSFDLSGWLGGWLAQEDNALLYVSFLGVDDSEIGGAAIGPVSPADRGNATGLLYRETEGWLPVGTAKLSFWLSMERLGGGDNDGYADNLSFVINAPAVIPEPPALALATLAFAAAVVARRRRGTGAR